MLVYKRRVIGNHQPRLQGALSLAQRVRDTYGASRKMRKAESDAKGADDGKRRESASIKFSKARREKN